MTTHILSIAVIALVAALIASLAFGAWQWGRANTLAKSADRLATCQEVQRLKRSAEDATDDDLADSISDGRSLWNIR